MDEPLIRLGNAGGAAVAGAAYVAGYPRIALALTALNVLDVVGRQVSPGYRDFVAGQTGLVKGVAGLGLLGNVLGIDVPTVKRWNYSGPGVPWVRTLRGG